MSPLGALRPGMRTKGIKIDWTKDELDKILEAAKGAGLSDLEQLGFRIPKDAYLEAEERMKIRRFIKEHLRISREKKKGMAEKFQVSSSPWRMGDPFRDVDLASSEVKSMGIPDLRMIPGVTLQKREYVQVRGQDREVLHGILFHVIIDVSGSMFERGTRGKIGKALLLAEETYKICKHLGYEFNLAVFSDKGHRIPKNKISSFFASEEERARIPGWNGGTSLSSALKLYKLSELKDSNLVILSDMDLADVDSTKKKLQEIGTVTNSFKVVLIRDEGEFREEEIDEIKKWFPNNEVSILSIPVREY